jgi:hypothetical protein
MCSEENGLEEHIYCLSHENKMQLKFNILEF